MSEGGTRSGALAALVLIIFGFVVAGALAEGMTRIYAHTADTVLARQLRADPLAMLVEAHGEWGYRQKANSTFRYDNGTRATSNSMNFRGPEVSRDEPAETIRVVLLGGSTTHGWGVNDDETIDHHMRSLLVSRHPELSFEVINLAFDGYDSYQLYERLKEDGLALNPDFVIVNTGVNDVRNARYADLEDADPRTMLWLSAIERSRREQESGGPSFWTGIKHYFYVARLPGAARSVFATAETTKAEVTPQPDAMDYFTRNLRRMLELVRDRETVMLLSSEPSSLLTKYRPDDTSTISYWVGDAATTQTYRDSLRARLEGVADSASREGLRVGRVPYLELDPILFLDDAHLTTEGNRRVARAFVDAMEPYLENVQRDLHVQAP